MGRKMKMGHLDEKECEWIMGVIHRDFDLRQKEQERLNKIESELNEAASQRNVLAKRKEFNDKCCILCCASFNLLFNKKLQCGNCHFHICRNCATWESQTKVWICRVCEQQRLLYIQSCEWFYDHIRQRFQHFGSAKILDTLRRKRKESGVDSENDSGYGPQFPEGRQGLSLQQLWPGLQARIRDGQLSPNPDSPELKEDSELTEVRQHIETVVEGLVGENVDSARVDKAYSHPQYLQLFSLFHKPLVEAVGKLSQALSAALQNKPPVGDVTPTTAHASLKQTILDIGDKVAALPCLVSNRVSETESPRDGLPSPSDLELLDSCICQTYEELLASAIINKLVDLSQKLQYGVQYGRESSHSDLSASDSDVLMKSASNKEEDCPGGTTPSSESSERSESLMEDFESGSVGEPDRADDEFAFVSGLSIPPQTVEYVIEERIEEVTREQYSDEGEHEDEVDGKRRKFATRRYSSIGEELSDKTTRCMPDLDFLNDWDLDKSHRVPFPEFGVDIVDDTFEFSDNEDPEQDDSSVRHSDIAVWEENWLFRKKKLPPYGGMRHQLMGTFYGEPPCLLIPNSQDDLQAQIDSRDVDTLSELSEQQSVGSLDFSDSNDESEPDDLVSGESEELVRLAQNVAKHFSSANYSTETIASSTPVKNSPRLLKREVVSRPPLPATITLTPPKFVTREKRMACTDPSFVNTPDDLTIHAGKVAQFKCQVTGTRPIGVSWFRKGDLLGDGGRFQMVNLPTRGIYTLNIFETDTDDTGVYSCVAYGSKGNQTWLDFQLKVRLSTRASCPPEFTLPLRVTSSIPSVEARLTCTLAGYPEPKVLFFHNRRPIVSSEKNTIEYNGYGEWTLSISNIDSSSEGGYEVVASNRIGHAVSTATHRLGETTPVAVPIKADKHNEVKNQNVSKKSTEEEVTNDKNPNKFRPLVVQRTWLQRQVQIENEHKGISENRTVTNGNGYVNKMPAELSSPPKPGSIAEREHRKWENAAPLPNNPYSRENVTKRRLERQISDIDLKEPAMTFQEFSKQREEQEIQLGGTGALNKSLEKDYARYRRDYYVNGVEGRGRTNGHSEVGGVRRNPDKPQQQVLNSLEERVYVSASELLNLEDHVKSLVREVESPSSDLSGDRVAELENRVAQVLAQVEHSNIHVSRVESEVEQLQHLRKNSICTSSESGSASGMNKNSMSSDEDYGSSALPSVKSLASLFVAPTNNPVASSSQLPNPTRSPLLVEDKEVVIVEAQIAPRVNYQVAQEVPPSKQHPILPVVKRLSQQFDQTDLSGATVQRVHSLTARSLSKEFRQLTQKNHPRPMNRNLSVTSSSQPTSLETDRSSSPSFTCPSSPPPNEEDYSPTPHYPLLSPGGGYTSDESSANSNPSSSLPRQRNKKNSMSKTILQRASYWERRAEQGLLSDTSVNEEFPSMDKK